MRDRLPQNIAKRKTFLTPSLADGTMDLYEGYEAVEDAGKLDDVVKKLKAFKKVVSEPCSEKQVMWCNRSYDS